MQKIPLQRLNDSSGKQTQQVVLHKTSLSLFHQLKSNFLCCDKSVPDQYVAPTHLGKHKPVQAIGEAEWERGKECIGCIGHEAQLIPEASEVQTE